MTNVFPCSSADISFSLDTISPTLKVKSGSHTLKALETARHHLLELRQPIAFPTETVYGLGAPALNPNTVAMIFTTKGRPPDNPLIVHVSSMEMLTSILPSTYTPSPTYKKLMEVFWPGPLTLLFPADPAIVPSIVTAGHPTVAVRMPSHPIARALIAFCDTPLAAPSANSSGKPSPTRADHVIRDLNSKVGLILDDGSTCDIGLESTVVDGLGVDGNLRVLRPGGVTVEDLERVVGEMDVAGETPKVLVHKRDFKDSALEEAPTTPGMKYRHYSPSVPVILLMTSQTRAGQPVESLPDILRSILPSSIGPIKVGTMFLRDSMLTQQLPSDDEKMVYDQYDLGPKNSPLITAQRLFDGLLTLEREGAKVIMIEGIDEVQEGLAVMNRVKKAAAETRWVKID